MPQHLTPGWEANMGCLSVGSKGTRLKPQCMLGLQVANFKAEAGMHDVRDGLKVCVKAEAELVVEATGNSFAELHESIQCDTVGFRQALEVAKKLLSGATDKIANVLGVSQETLDKSLAGQSEDAEQPESAARRGPMTLRVKAETGVGMGAHVCLGWKDTKGYHMVGVSGKASAALSLQGTVFVGRHKSGVMAKIILGVGNFKFYYTFPIGDLPEPEQCKLCDATGQRKGFITTYTCNKCKGKGLVSVLDS